MVLKRWPTLLLGLVALIGLLAGAGLGFAQEKRKVEISLASSKGLAEFTKTADALGGVEGVTLYRKLELIADDESLEYAKFPENLQVTLVLEITKEACGDHILRQIVPSKPGEAGSCDARLDDFAKKVNKAGRRIRLRFFHEFNLGAHEWSIYAAGNNPEEFVPAWRYVVGFLRARTSLLEFDWNPNRLSFYENKKPVPGDGADIAAAYPGDDVVDSASAASYDRGMLWPNKPHQSFADGYRKIYQLILRTVGPKVRIGVSETATTSEGGFDKAKWYKEMLDWVKNDATRIDYVCFFFIDTFKKKPNGELDAKWGLHGYRELNDMRMNLAAFRGVKIKPLEP